MELVRVCWGKDEVHLKRSEVRTLEALKERLQVVEGFDTNGMQTQFGIQREKQTLFFNDHYLRTDNQLIDAVESTNPIIYVHSQPPFCIYLKFGWLLKMVEIFSFYPIEYISYLSLDVENVKLCKIQVLECELGCSIDDQDIHLLFDGRLLLNPRESAYSAGLHEGSIVEMSVSNSTSIAILLKAMQSVQREQMMQAVQMEQITQRKEDDSQKVPICRVLYFSGDTILLCFQ